MSPSLAAVQAEEIAELRARLAKAEESKAIFEASHAHFESLLADRDAAQAELAKAKETIAFIDFATSKVRNAEARADAAEARAKEAEKKAGENWRHNLNSQRAVHEAEARESVLRGALEEIADGRDIYEARATARAAIESAKQEAP